MKKQKDAINYFFVDESGDPYFYDRYGNYIVGKEGCSKILILGFIKTEDPKELRDATSRIRKEIMSDSYTKSIPSLKKSLNSFHATDDCPEVREKVFKTILNLKFKAEFIVARKIENVFRNKHKGKPNLFYDDLISKLFQNQLHSSKKNIIYFSIRTNRARQAPLEDAIYNAVNSFENRWKTKVDSEIKIYPQSPIAEPSLQIIDYMIWAVQRAFVKKETRYLDYIGDKISLIADIYDFDRFGKNYYNKKNPMDINTISPL
mgnify:CR=1 FL=1